MAMTTYLSGTPVLMKDKNRNNVLYYNNANLIFMDDGKTVYDRISQLLGHTHNNIVGGNSSITSGTGNDYAGLDRKNNCDVNTWWGFSVSPSISGQTIPKDKPAFSVDARNGNTWVGGDISLNGKIQTPNNKQGIYVGDDASIGDGNVANCIVIEGQQDPSIGGIVFGSDKNTKIMSDGHGNVTINNNKIVNNKELAKMANNYAVTSGDGNYYNISLPDVEYYNDGLTVVILPNTNCGNQPRIRINELSYLLIKNSDGELLSSQELKAWIPVILVYVGGYFFIRANSAGDKKPNDKPTDIPVNPGTLIISESYSYNIEYIIGIKNAYVFYYVDNNGALYEYNIKKRTSTMIKSSGFLANPRSRDGHAKPVLQKWKNKYYLYNTSVYDLNFNKLFSFDNLIDFRGQVFEERASGDRSTITLKITDYGYFITDPLTDNAYFVHAHAASNTVQHALVNSSTSSWFDYVTEYHFTIHPISDDGRGGCGFLTSISNDGIYDGSEVLGICNGYIYAYIKSPYYFRCSNYNYIKKYRASGDLHGNVMDQYKQYTSGNSSIDAQNYMNVALVHSQGHDTLVRVSKYYQKDGSRDSYTTHDGAYLFSITDESRPWSFSYKPSPTSYPKESFNTGHGYTSLSQLEAEYPEIIAYFNNGYEYSFYDKTCITNNTNQWITDGGLFGYKMDGSYFHTENLGYTFYAMTSKYGIRYNNNRSYVGRDMDGWAIYTYSCTLEIYQL